jgi:hypothetical protein
MEYDGPHKMGSNRGQIWPIGQLNVHTMVFAGI